MCNQFICGYYQQETNSCQGECRFDVNCKVRLEDGEMPDWKNSEEEFYKLHPECKTCLATTGFECSKCETYF